jgi:hypothetical protein
MSSLQSLEDAKERKVKKTLKFVLEICDLLQLKSALKKFAIHTAKDILFTKELSNVFIKPLAAIAIYYAANELKHTIKFESKLIFPTHSLPFFQNLIFL